MGITNTPVESPKFTLNKNDVEKWARNSAIFFAPFALVFLLAIQSGTPVKQALLAVYLYGLNVTIDLLRKFIDGNPQE